MIKITINKSVDIYQFNVNGHAAFAKYGQDIVCAAVSTALIMTGNLLLKYKDGYNIIELESKEGLFNLKVRNDEYVMLICDNLRDTLAEIARQYPQNVKFNG